VTDIKVINAEVNLVSVERSVASATNRKAALTAADWAWRHHEPISELLEVLETLGIDKTDIAATAPQSVTLP
jgi:hypothetical protein